MLEVLFLGTGASTPSRQSGLPSVAIRKGRNIYLMDCGEGTQRQLMVSPFSYMKINTVMISHLHGDHFLGLPGLLLTMGISDRKKPITVIGPKGMKEILLRILEVCGDELPYELNILELSDGDIFDAGDVIISVFETDHTVPSLGFVLSEKDRLRASPSKIEELGVKSEDVEKILKGESIDGITGKDISSGVVRGLKLVYSGDTRPCQSLISAAKDADMLIHEATFKSDLTGPAEEHGHSTAVQAAEAAKKSNVRCLCLTHISNRYRNRNVLKKEAAAIFSNVIIAYDMLRIMITHKEIKSILKDPYP